MSPDSPNPESDRTVGLKLVDDSSGSETPASDASSTPESSDSERRGLPRWLFVLMLIVLAVVIGWQAQRAGELEGQIVDLEQQLTRTNAQLEAHRSRLVDIRDGVHTLAERFADLRSLVDADPTTPHVIEASEPMGSDPTRR